MMGRAKALCALLLLLALTVAVSSAPREAAPALQAQASDTVQLRASLLSAAGRITTAGPFRMKGSLGQPLSTGRGSGEDLRLHPGFWAPYQRLWLTDVPLAEPLLDRLFPNSPNPFNPVTRIRYWVARDGRVRITIYDLRGRRVRDLVNEVRPAGRYVAVWDGRDDGGRGVASGVYLYRLSTGGFGAVRKMLLLK